MNAVTNIAAYLPLDPRRARAAGRCRSQRRQRFEALLLRSFTIMQERSGGR